MRGELPLCLRCCFCFPLRYGLITWGCFKLVIIGLAIVSLSFELDHYVSLQLLRKQLLEATTTEHATNGSIVDDEGYNYVPYDRSDNIIILSVMLAFFVTDFLTTIMFVIGGIKKSVRLLSIFYYYSIVEWILSMIPIIISIGASIAMYIHHFPYKYLIVGDIVRFSFFFTVMVIQTYFLLLLRSEINKLRRNGQYSFTNNAAEAEQAKTEVTD